MRCIYDGDERFDCWSLRGCDVIVLDAEREAGIESLLSWTSVLSWKRVWCCCLAVRRTPAGGS